MAQKPVPAAQKPKLSPQEEMVAKAKRQEAKALNFKRLINKRMSNVLAKLDGVRQLSNRNSYHYEAAQITAVLNALKRGVNEIEAAYTATATVERKRFEI